MTLQPPVPNTHNLPHGLHLGIPKQPGQDATDAALRYFAPDPFRDAWYNWDTDGQVPMCWTVKSRRSLDAIQQAARTGDKRLWLVENEPDPLGPQSKSSPQEIAAAAQTWHGKVPWAGFGLLINYPNYPAARYWIDWLELYFRSGGPVPDAWHIHVYSDWPNTWRYQLRDFTSWMTDTNNTRPVIVSECGGWPRNPPDEQAAVMAGVVDALLAEEIVAAFWFSSFYPAWANGNLLIERNGVYSLGWLGERFLAQRARLRRGPQTVPEPVPTPDPIPEPGPEPTPEPRPELPVRAHVLHLPIVGRS